MLSQSQFSDILVFLHCSKLICYFIDVEIKQAQL